MPSSKKPAAARTASKPKTARAVSALDLSASDLLALPRDELARMGEEARARMNASQAKLRAGIEAMRAGIHAG